jgi:hypothetical protein
MRDNGKICKPKFSDGERPKIAFPVDDFKKVYKACAAGSKSVFILSKKRKLLILYL